MFLLRSNNFFLVKEALWVYMRDQELTCRVTARPSQPLMTTFPYSRCNWWRSWSRVKGQYVNVKTCHKGLETYSVNQIFRQCSYSDAVLTPIPTERARLLSAYLASAVIPVPMEALSQTPEKEAMLFSVKSLGTSPPCTPHTTQSPAYSACWLARS